MESRDLLTTFRFDNDGARKQIHSWFEGKDGWKLKHKVCEEFIKKLSWQDAEFARRWGILSGLSHPTACATENSAALIAQGVIPSMSDNEMFDMMRPKIADSVTNVASLFLLQHATLQVGLASNVTCAECQPRNRSD